MTTQKNVAATDDKEDGGYDDTNDRDAKIDIETQQENEEDDEASPCVARRRHQQLLTSSQKNNHHDPNAYRCRTDPSNPNTTIRKLLQHIELLTVYLHILYLIYIYIYQYLVYAYDDDDNDRDEEEDDKNLGPKCSLMEIES